MGRRGVEVGIGTALAAAPARVQALGRHHGAPGATALAAPAMTSAWLWVLLLVARRGHTPRRRAMHTPTPRTRLTQVLVPPPHSRLQHTVRRPPPTPRPTSPARRCTRPTGTRGTTCSTSRCGAVSTGRSTSRTTPLRSTRLGTTRTCRARRHPPPLRLAGHGPCRTRWASCTWTAERTPPSRRQFPPTCPSCSHTLSTCPCSKRRLRTTLSPRPQSRPTRRRRPTPRTRAALAAVSVRPNPLLAAVPLCLLWPSSSWW